MKKFIAVILALVLVLALAACGGGGGGGTADTDGPHQLRVGLVGAFNAHWELIQEMVAEEGIELELVFFADFAMPNLALDAGDIDLNAFQHKMFFFNDMATNDYELQYIAETFIAPLNIFNNPDRISSLEDIQDGHTIAIPSDPTNSGRALRLLEAAGLLVLDVPDGAIPSVLDIAAYNVEINIIEAEAGMLANILPDVEAAVINNPHAFNGGLRAEDSIFVEDITGEAAANLINIIAVRTADVEAGGLRMELFEIIVRAHHTDAVRQLMIEEYLGSLVPVW